MRDMFGPVNSLPGAVTIPRTQWDEMDRLARSVTHGYETGGIVLGSTSAEQFDVTVLGPPGPSATHRPAAFLRDLRTAQALAAEAWEQDRSEWIGEWHTHPRSGLAPSPTDLATYHRHLDDPELRFERFLSVIARPTSDKLLVACWSVSPTTLIRLPVTIYDDPSARSVKRTAPSPDPDLTRATGTYPLSPHS
ncbi:Mov34/MPN/PAD-1 family protein [Plantibacter sp. ME-Dv--P-095]|uniref:Mov34/MPN/PAD-1 family protein n=1 Tax=Plantibacter sp. ME-Dv--P-095 TaxID=3040299 RepID=UPI003305B549